MSRPRVYSSDNERLQAWRKRKCQEQRERRQQTSLEEFPQGHAESASLEQLAGAVKRLEFIAESMVTGGFCSRAEATDMQVLVRVMVREPGLFEKWGMERAHTELRGVVPWHEE